MEKCKKVKIKNKTYQPLQLIIGSETVILEGMNNNNELILQDFKLTEQIKNFKEQGLVSIIKLRK